MMLKLKNKIEGLIWASSRETKCPEGDSILSLKNQQPDTITGVFIAHRLIINNVDWVYAELAWHKDMKKQHKLNNTEQLQGRGHWWLQPCVGTRNSISCQLIEDQELLKWGHECCTQLQTQNSKTLTLPVTGLWRIQAAFNSSVTPSDWLLCCHNLTQGGKKWKRQTDFISGMWEARRRQKK